MRHVNDVQINNQSDSNGFVCMCMVINDNEWSIYETECLKTMCEWMNGRIYRIVEACPKHHTSSMYYECQHRSGLCVWSVQCIQWCYDVRIYIYIYIYMNVIQWSNTSPLWLWLCHSEVRMHYGKHRAYIGGGGLSVCVCVYVYLLERLSCLR